MSQSDVSGLHVFKHSPDINIDMLLVKHAVCFELLSLSCFLASAFSAGDKGLL